MAEDVAAAVEALYRSDWGRIVATLIRLLGDFDLAEEAAQEAFATALDQWRTSGVPDGAACVDHPDRAAQGDGPIRRRQRFEEKRELARRFEWTRTVERPDEEPRGFPTIACA